jgi:hypothetical protein
MAATITLVALGHVALTIKKLLIFWLVIVEDALLHEFVDIL